MKFKAYSRGAQHHLEFEAPDRRRAEQFCREVGLEDLKPVGSRSLFARSLRTVADFARSL